jgi:aminoglycoside phosphotransferase (APT) family kinase protein
LERPGPARDAVADRILPGWDAWDRLATPAACDAVGRLTADSQPLLDALARRPSTVLHGDLKLANAGIAADGSVELVDWQMVMVAPVAIELGWFLVSNVNALPIAPQDVLDRYWKRRGLDGSGENDLAILVGLLLRGWRKGLDAEAGITLASGVSAADDLAWWCERALEAADRSL